jgi:hypothetical protein
LSFLFVLQHKKNIGNFAPGTDSMDSDAEIENHERQLEQTLLQLKIAKSVAEAKQFCTTDLDDFDDEEDDLEDFTDFSKINDCESLLLAP